MCKYPAEWLGNVNRFDVLAAECRRRAWGGRTMKRPWTREQLATALQGILCIVLFLVILQLWLLNVTVSAYLGGDEAVLWPAAVASLACCTLNVSLFRYLNVLERPRATQPL